MGFGEKGAGCSLLLWRRRTSSEPMWAGSVPTDNVMDETMLHAGQGRCVCAE